MEKQKWTHYGLDIYAEGTREYAYAPDDEAADKACEEYVRGSLWAFRPEFIASYCPSGVDADIIKILQEKCEDANEAIYRLVKDQFSSLVEDAICADGHGHFLASYDGQERDASEAGLEIEGLVYRLG